MSKQETIISHILEIVHPVLLAALAGPVCYAVYENRVDRWILPLYISGLSLLLLSAAVRIAERKVRSLWVYLLISAAAFAVSFFLGRAVAGIAFTAPSGYEQISRGPRTMASAVLVAGGVWITLSAMQIRLRENRRERARLESDYTWQERSVLAEKPGAPLLLLFGLAYLDGLFNACPSLCDLAVAGGVAYLVVMMVYRSIEVTKKYMQETQNVVNVPRGKISEIRGRLLAAVIVVLCIASATAFWTAGFRTYRDLRKWELKGERIEVTDQGLDLSYPDFEVIEEEFGLGIAQERRDPPAWLTAFESAAKAAVLIGLAMFAIYRVWRSITGTAKEFAEVREENGDVAVRLTDDPDETDRLSAGRIRRFVRGQPLTEREKIRQEYRRTISRYRKSPPERSETPSQIESGADFPQGFDAEALHERYEKARYGRAETP